MHTVCMFLIFSHIESIAALLCCHKLKSSSFEPGQEILIMLLTEMCSKWLGKWHGTFEVFKKLWTTTEIWIPNQTHLMRTLAQTQFLCKPESGSRPSWSGFTCLVGHDKVLKESAVPLTEIPERNPQCLKRCWMSKANGAVQWFSTKEGWKHSVLHRHPLGCSSWVLAGFRSPWANHWICSFTSVLYKCFSEPRLHKQ